MHKISTMREITPGQREVGRDFPEKVMMGLRSEGEMKVSWVRRK